MPCDDPDHLQLDRLVRDLREDILVLEAELAEARGRPGRRQFRSKRHSRFERAQLQAADRGIDWYISSDDFDALVIRPCTDCGNPVGGEVGLDRLDEDGPYSIENVEPCCGRCNKRRHREYDGPRRPVLPACAPLPEPAKPTMDLLHPESRPVLGRRAFE